MSVQQHPVHPLLYLLLNLMSLQQHPVQPLLYLLLILMSLQQHPVQPPLYLLLNLMSLQLLLLQMTEQHWTLFCSPSPPVPVCSG